MIDSMVEGMKHAGQEIIAERDATTQVLPVSKPMSFRGQVIHEPGEKLTLADYRKRLSKVLGPKDQDKLEPMMQRFREIQRLAREKQAK